MESKTAIYVKCRPQDADTAAPIASGIIGLDSADLLIVKDRIAEVDGYPIHFARDIKGAWRIAAM
jgi:hypothetical protein